MFVVYITVKSTLYICNKWEPFYLVLIGVFAFTFIKHIEYIYTQPQNLHSLLYSNKSLQCKKIIVTTDLKQNILLYTEWLNASLYRTDDLNDIDTYRGEIVLLNKKQVHDIQDNIEHLQSVYCIVLILQKNFIIEFEVCSKSFLKYHNILKPF